MGALEKNTHRKRTEEKMQSSIQTEVSYMKNFKQRGIK
jgi:hypothetical protein